MRLGIIGFPQTGKTTVFNALTRGDRPTTVGGRNEVHTAVVDVPDIRVDRLTEIFRPKKVTHAKVEYADIAGLEGGGGGQGLSNALLHELANMDGFLHVVRCFEDDSIPHHAGRIDPAADIAGMEAELLLNDLIAVERKLERLEEERGKGGRDRAEIEREQDLFRRLQATLNEEAPLREMDLTAEEERSLSGFGFLTRKPMLVVLNLGEGQAPPSLEALHGGVVPLQGQLEMELAQLSIEEAAEFLKEYGIQELGLSRMIRESYELVGLLSFFTGGEKEVRAWTVRRGANARQAAGEIHTDIERGFIRAEVVSYADLDALGSIAAARDKGKLRVEGKDYIVQDGDVITVRFNI